MFKKNEVVINSKKTFYWEKNSANKKVIILLHGFPGNHLGFIDVANHLGDHRFIIPDLPACGQSDLLGGKHNLENYSKWLEEFLKSLSIDKAIIIGHSFGARLGLVFSSYHPEKVERLVLITPVVKVEGLIARVVSIEYKIAEILPEYLKKLWLVHGFHRRVGNVIVFKSACKARRQELIARESEEFKHLNPKINIELFDEFYKFSLVPVGKKVTTKSLIIAGQEDEVAPLDTIKELAEQLVGVKFVVMKNSGHVLVVEKPLTTASIIRKWLSE